VLRLDRALGLDRARVVERVRVLERVRVPCPARPLGRFRAELPLRVADPFCFRAELPRWVADPLLDERPLERLFEAAVVERDLEDFDDVPRREDALVWAMFSLLLLGIRSGSRYPASIGLIAGSCGEGDEIRHVCRCRRWER
jgi:hypothetical protein